MSSQYPILNNRPIDQWKVVELKEELKRRKIPVRGLKEELVRKLDEAIRHEMATAKEKQLQNDPKSDSDYQENGSLVQEDPAEKDDPDNPPDAIEQIVNDNAIADLDDSTVDIQDNKDQSVETVPRAGNDATTVETEAHSLQMEDSATESQSMEPSDSTVNHSNTHEKHEDWKAPVEDAKHSPSEPEKQVPVVSPDLGSPVKSEFITTDSVSINEKNNLKDNLNANNFHLELEVVKPEMVQPSSNTVPPLGGDVHPLDDEKEQIKNLASLDQVDTNHSTELDIGKKEDIVDVGSPEKLNLDRSSGDESMDEDVIEPKHVEPSIESMQLGEQSAVIEDTGKATDTVAVLDGPNLEKANAMDDEKNKPTVVSEKRKLEVQPPVSAEPVKRQRRWSSETLKVPEAVLERQPSNVSSSGTPKNPLQPIPRHTFTRTESKTIGDPPKERFVPPPQKPTTTSLRIDKFVRPFTLKAVQQMLAKTGTVCSFWMDQIKTHCYVTYSSVEEAVATRNAVYNLQWPPNGGNLLVAEFVDPQEVKMRVEAPSQLPAPISPSPNTPKAQGFQQSQPAQSTARQQMVPSPRQQVEPLPRQQVLPLLPPLMQPPPSSDSSFATKELPTPPKKAESPVAVTLDDLFKKTKTTPRIYYLPLSEEQVAAKVATAGTS